VNGLPQARQTKAAPFFSAIVFAALNLFWLKITMPITSHLHGQTINNYGKYRTKKEGCYVAFWH
jgi:hypothetical protein